MDLVYPSALLFSFHGIIDMSGLFAWPCAYSTEYSRILLLWGSEVHIAFLKETEGHCINTLCVWEITQTLVNFFPSEHSVYNEMVS